MRWKIFQWMNSYLGILQIHENWAGRNFIMNSCIHCSITRAKKWPIGTAQIISFWLHLTLFQLHLIVLLSNGIFPRTIGSPQGLLLYSSMWQKRQHRQLSCNISYLYDWQSIWKNYLSIITSLPILSDHSILSKNQNPDSIVLHTIVTALLEACNIDIGNVNTVAFLDLKKAFDTVCSHDILLSQYVFIVYHGHVTQKCFFPYNLDNHTQKCLVNGFLSECCTVKCGFPQGTTLGPLLFLLYINDLLNKLSVSF